MEQDSGASQSVWMDSAEFPPADELSKTHAEILIVGAGIAGLTCAYELCSVGRQVLVLDDGPPAGGETCRTTAHLASALDDRFTELERLHGEKGSRLAYESHAAAIDRIEEIIKTESIDCDFQRLSGYLFAGKNDGDETLKEECEAARRAGFIDAHLTETSPVPGLTAGSCIVFPNQAQFDPIKYLAAVMKAVQRMGGIIATNKFVTVIEENQSGVRATLEDGTVIRGDYGIVATNAPIVSLTMQTKQAPYRTYAIAVEVNADAITPGLYWDTEDPYHYIRLQKGNGRQGEKDLLIIGGEDHKTGQDHEPENRFNALYEWAKPRFPHLGSIQYQWSGQVMEPADGLGFIGRAPGGKKMFVATGDSGMGMTHGTIAGMLIPDLIQGRENKFETLYDPSRFSLKSLGSLIGENLTAVPQLAKRIAGTGDVKSAEEITPGSAALMRQGLQKVACYRDESGTLHSLSAKCTHLGCQVEWNSVEKSWDCPCHGSRFNIDGTVLNGPATVPLSKVP